MRDYLTSPPIHEGSTKLLRKGFEVIDKDAATLKEKSIRIRVTEHEYLKLHAFAVRQHRTASQVLREYIHRLPDYIAKETLEDSL